MIRTFAPIASSAWRAAIALLTVEIAIVSGMRYFIGSASPPPPIAANAFADPFLLLHAIGGVTALLAAPLQFVKWVRRRWPSFHRATGRVYMGACAIGAPAGFMLALGTTAGPFASVGFAIPALLWALFTWAGWRAAVDRRFAAHRNWMLRSYALTSTAITLRLMLPASAMMGIGFDHAYPVIAWISWLTNLALFEVFIRRERGTQDHSARAVRDGAALSPA
jgi:uncharacterized membrane protein